MNRTRTLKAGAAGTFVVAVMGVVVALSAGQGGAGPLPCAQPDANCQLPDIKNFPGGVILSSVQSQDNFVTADSGDITAVCFWGAYLNTDVNVDCGPGPGGDTVMVTYFENVEGFPPSPGAILAGPFDVSASVTKAATGNEFLLAGFDDPSAEFEFTATHDPVAVLAGTCYWIEITISTGDPKVEPCQWFWEVSPAFDLGLGGDDLSRDADGVNEWDYAWCIDQALEFDPNFPCSGANEGCEGATNDCRTETSPDPGCADKECCTLVCEDQPFCCLPIGGGGTGWMQSCVEAAIELCPIVFPTDELESSDGMWRAIIGSLAADTVGQIRDFFTPDQPATDNVFETLLYEASTDSGGLSRRVEDNYVLTEAVVDMDGTHSLARLETVGGSIAITLENFMIDGADGGVQVKVTCENVSAAPTDCKIFYYCDYDISGDFGDDEASLIPGPGPSGVHAVEQIDNMGDGPKPLWFGGCPSYTGWEINTWSDLRADLDGGIAALANVDGTAPGNDDHTAALSSALVTLQPGETVTISYGIGAVGFTSLPDCEPPEGEPCPWDCQEIPDGDVGINDFLGLLAQWGLVDTSCDFDGGGVGINDFLKLLAQWGACP